MQLPLRLPSSKPDLTCADGEVARFSNVPWLQALADQANASKPSSGSSGNGSGTSAADKTPPRLSLAVTDLPVALPFGAVLLAIHSPASLDGERRYLVHTQNYSLAVVSPDGESQILIPDTYDYPGEIRSVAVYGDFILLVTQKSLLWIVFDPATLSYSIPAAGAAAPDITFSLSPVALPDYALSPGLWPSLAVAVDLPAAEEVSATMLTNWLDLGSGTAVNASVRQAVFKAVGAAVESFIAEARRRGVFLSSVKCMASFDGALPTPRITVEAPASTSNPCAILDSWTYHAGTLHLRLSLILLPLALSASFLTPDDQRIWVNRFDSLDICVTSQTPLFPAASGALEATGLTSYTEPSTGQRRGFAFRFPAFSDAERQRSLAALDDFRLVLSRHPARAATTTLRLRPATSADPLFTPCYSDLTTSRPADVVATDQGFVVFGGYADLGMDREVWPLKSKRVPLRGALLSGIPKYPFIFRHFTQVSDGEIRIVSATSASRSASPAGRHPLHVLSSDGIRRLEADGEGGYLNGRLISRLVADSSLSASHADLLYFFTAEGLHSLSLSSAVKSLGLPMPDADGLPAPEGVREWEQMAMLTDGTTLLLRGPGRTALLDLDAERCIALPDVSLRPIVGFEDCVYTLSPSRNLQRVSLVKTPADAVVTPTYPPAVIDPGFSLLSADDTHTPSQDSAAIMSSSSADEENGTARVLPLYADIETRPLKFGAGPKGTRLRGVQAANKDIFMILEGSQNLIDWFEIARGYGHIFPLHTPAIRFYRLRARTTIDRAHLLASFHFIM